MRSKHLALLLVLLVATYSMVQKGLVANTIEGIPAAIPQSNYHDQSKLSTISRDGRGEGTFTAAPPSKRVVTAGDATTSTTDSSTTAATFPWLPFPISNGEGVSPPAELMKKHTVDTNNKDEAFLLQVDTRPWLVVVGIPTVDNPVGAERRQRQRASWLQYSAVANKKQTADAPASTDVDHMMLVRYIVGRHPANTLLFSDALQEESKKNQDILALDLPEGKPSSGKKSGQAGYWGLDAEVGMSRKAYAWFTTALTLYPNAKYYMKGDDDVFLRVPQYIHDLTVRIPKANGGKSNNNLPLYWGKAMKWGAKKNDPKSKFYFIGGMSITMDRRLATLISAQGGEASLEPREQEEDVGALSKKVASMSRANRFEWLRRPYSEANRPIYKSFNMDHEDVMMGRLLYDTNTPTLIVKDCRYHDVHAGANVKPVTAKSVAIHHLKVEEYQSMMVRFGEEKELDMKSLGDSSPYDVPPGSQIIQLC